MPELEVAGLICYTTIRFGENFNAIPRFWQEHLHNGMIEQLQQESFVKNQITYGVYLPENPITGNFEYLVCAEVKQDVEIPQPYVVKKLPAASYMVFSSSPVDAAFFSTEVYNTWAYIYGTWIPQSRFVLNGDAVHFELYDERAQPERGKVCDLYVPVIYAPGKTVFPFELEIPPVEALPGVKSGQGSPNTVAVKV
jgi:predicted transcriptional regulator YdeE